MKFKSGDQARKQPMGAQQRALARRQARLRRQTNKTESTESSRSRSWLIDLALILILSFLAQATHFSYKQGRALVCGDSAQYVAAAEALVDGSATPHFEMRKPGYVLLLAAFLLLFGNMGWPVVAAQHVLLGLLPVAAYGWGWNLHSRWAGWIAALMAIARLQDVIWGDRMMSEALFTFLFSFGLLAFVVALGKERCTRWMAAAGVLLGLSWLTRGNATPAIAVAAVTLILVMWGTWRRAATSMAVFATPILGCILLESGLNLMYSDQFRLSNGTVGAATLLRARYFEGFELPPTEDADRVYSLLPERSRYDAYVASHLDVWVARYHAIHDQGMSEWEYDELMGRVGQGALSLNASAYLSSSLRLAIAHLLREHDARVYSPVPEARRFPHLRHPAATTAADWETTWFAYYGLPHLNQKDSISLVNRMKVAAGMRAPIGDGGIWRAFRYWKTKSFAEWTELVLKRMGSIWPGFALLAFWFIGLNRRTCAMLVAIYFLDAVFLGLLIPTNYRFQFIWFAIDTALAAALLSGVVGAAAHYLAARFGHTRTRVSTIAGRA